MLIGDDSNVVEGPSKSAATTALREAGATVILPIVDDLEGVDALDGSDPFARWLGLNAADLIIGEVRPVDQPCLDRRGYDAG
jgi:hypothetical protein